MVLPLVFFIVPLSLATWFSGIPDHDAVALSTAVTLGTAAFLMVRFGLLAVAAQSVALILIEDSPITLDMSRWYFGHGLFTATVVSVIALVSYRIATAPHRRRGHRRGLPDIPSVPPPRNERR